MLIWLKNQRMVRYRTFQLRFTDADTCRDFPASYRAIAFELMRRNCKKEYLEAMIRLAEHDEIRAEEEFEKNRFELLQLEKEGKVLLKHNAAYYGYNKDGTRGRYMLPNAPSYEELDREAQKELQEWREAMFFLTPSQNGFSSNSNFFLFVFLTFRESFSEKFDNFRCEISGYWRI